MNELRWDDKGKLYLNGEHVMSIIRNKAFRMMYHIEYPDRTKSDEYWNKARAKDLCLKIMLRSLKEEAELLGKNTASVSLKQEDVDMPMMDLVEEVEKK